MPGEALQWLARGEASIPSGEGWLRQQERQRLAGMRFTKRRTEYLVRRLAGKCAVSARFGLAEDEATLRRIGVLNHPTGAPYVTLDDQPAGLEVSLTDRGGWAVCLVAGSLGAVGVDLEIVEPRSPGFVTDFLTPVERRDVAQCAAAGPDGHDAAANLIWSAKESALKVLRVGLRADTRTVEVRLSDPLAPARDDAPRWSPLTVSTRVGTMPGFWRRDGVFLLTMVTEPDSELRPPEVLPGSADLAAARPANTWMSNPLAE